jgi:hypothetical protein
VCEDALTVFHSTRNTDVFPVNISTNIFVFINKFYVIISYVFGSPNFTHRSFIVRGILEERNEGLPVLKSECVKSGDAVA